MAKRYSGDVEIDVRWAWLPRENGYFYLAKVKAPGHRGEGILSAREIGIHGRQDPRSYESYDKAAAAFLALADHAYGIARYAEREGRKFVFRAIQQAPCPVEIPSRKKKR